MTKCSNTFSAEAYVSIKRVQEFLLTPESKHHRSSGNEKFNGNENYSRLIQNTHKPDKSIQLNGATATWGHDGDHRTTGIFDVTADIRTGLCAVVGPVGSGKSTLLHVILGEIELDAGSLTVNGSMSYASQEPWIFNGSVRNNIIFIEDFDEQRYNKVVEVCALNQDFKLLPHGDATIVGEHGASLSGGQKARVNLARAIYKRSDYYLLDDPLSAVDTQVGKHIFGQCISGFLMDKKCVLVTHQLQYLKNVDHAILLNNGRVEAQGPFSTLERLNSASLMNAQEEGHLDTYGSSQNEVLTFS